MIGRVAAFILSVIALVGALVFAVPSASAAGPGAHSGHAHADHVASAQSHSTDHGGKSHAHRHASPSGGAVPCLITPDNNGEHCPPCYASDEGLMASASIRAALAKKIIPAEPPALAVARVRGGLDDTPPVLRQRRIGFQPGPIHGDLLLVTRRLRI
jgi:hypothetical protein